MFKLSLPKFTILVFAIVVISLFLSSFYTSDILNNYKNAVKLPNSKSYRLSPKFERSETEEFMHSNFLKGEDDHNYKSIFKGDYKKPGEKLRDWHDYRFIEYEKSRVGLGEQGRPVVLTDPDEIQKNQDFYLQTGLYVVVSDKISVNRSMPDLRDPRCKYEKYLADLPHVSIIIIFYNEVLSVLKRTIHSVVNRSPKELIHEIILVNDCSDHAELYEPLQEYVFQTFGDLVRIKNLDERKGLIVTRLEGAKIATGEVLVFLDAHVEVTTNWLPPLLDPIARFRNISTVPIIDDFHDETFEYQVYGNGSRGMFDWNFIFKDRPRKFGEYLDTITPWPTPIMLGCAFAINREFFFELGTYDEGLEIWNGENYELSFKLWLCDKALGLYEVPCSRVAHNFRKINPSRASKRDFIGRNFKRIAEVWLDEYKEVLYSVDPNRYSKIDPGDLTKQKQLKKDLKCKPFKYFINEVAPDMAERYPPLVHPPVFASGAIRSLEAPDLCLDTFGRNMVFESIGMYPCIEGKNDTQYFHLNFYKGITTFNWDSCLDSYRIGFTDCNFLPFGNQYWRYDLVSGTNHEFVKLSASLNYFLGHQYADK